MSLEAVKNQQTLSEIGLKYDLSPVVISKWKVELSENMAGVFEKAGKKKEEDSLGVEQLYAPIGKLKVENEF